MAVVIGITYRKSGIYSLYQSHQLAPCVPLRVRAPILARRLADMLVSGQHLDVAQIVRVAAAVKGNDVIDFELACSAGQLRAVARSAKGSPAHRPPSSRVQLGVTAAHPTSALRNRRRGFGARESAPHASTSAAATSSRPVLLVPRFAMRIEP